MTDREVLAAMSEQVQLMRAWAQTRMIRAEIRELARQQTASRERKALDLAIKAIDAAGEFEGYAAIYGVKDEGNEVVDRGAFDDFFSSGAARLPLLFNHDINTVIGIAELTDSPTGLRVRGKLNLAVERAREIYQLVRQGAARGLSIGFRTIRSTYRGATRHLEAIKLYEISVTPFPMQRLATIETVKGGDRDLEQLGYLLADMRRWATARR